MIQMYKDPASSLAPNDCLPSHGECCRHRHRWGAGDDGQASIIAMFGGYDGGGSGLNVFWQQMVKKYLLLGVGLDGYYRLFTHSSQHGQLE